MSIIGPRFSPIDPPPNYESPLCCMCPDTNGPGSKKILVDYCPLDGSDPDFTLCHRPALARVWRYGLDDTTRCPVGDSCVSCRGTEALSVHTVGSLVGVFCVTVCAPCVQWEDLPNWAVASAANASLEHCAHLGITVDDMAELMELD